MQFRVLCSWLKCFYMKYWRDASFSGDTFCPYLKKTWVLGSISFAMVLLSLLTVARSDQVFVNGVVVKSCPTIYKRLSLYCMTTLTDTFFLNWALCMKGLPRDLSKLSKYESNYCIFQQQEWKKPETYTFFNWFDYLSTFVTAFPFLSRYLLEK